jgi:hypothetical protein
MSETVQFPAGETGDLASLEDLTRRANAGDPAAIARLSEFLAENTAFSQKDRSMATHAEPGWISTISDGDRLLKESLLLEADPLRRDLLSDHDTPVERVLIEQIVVTQLEARARQTQLANSPGITGRQQTAMLKAAESADRRMTQAVKTLQIVRLLVGR